MACPLLGVPLAVVWRLRERPADLRRRHNGRAKRAAVPDAGHSR